MESCTRGCCPREHSLFDGTARNAKLAEIIGKYNAIIDEKETDPSLRIEFEAK